MFGFFGSIPEFSPIFNISWTSVIFQFLLTLLIPPQFWVLCDINISWVFKPNSFYTVHSRISLFEICSIYRHLIISMSLLIKFFSSLLFLTIIHFLICIYSLIIAILTISGIWSDDSLHSGWIMWLLSSDEFEWRNIRSITKFESFWLSEYLVGTKLGALNLYKVIESAISLSRSL